MRNRWPSWYNTGMSKSLVKLDLLLAVYIAAIVAAELLGAKTFPVFFVNASVAIFVFPLTFSINDMVAEVYGKARARSFVRSGLWVLIGLFLFTLLAVALPPTSRFAEVDPAYRLVFGKSLRIMVASLVAFFVSERLDVYLFWRIRQWLGTKRLWLRNNGSNIIGQLVDTSVFMMLAFWQPGSFWFVVSLIVPYWLLKSSASVILTPLTYAGVRWLKKGKR